MAEIEVTISNIEASKLNENVNEEEDVAFNVDASITETQRDPGRVALKYVIKLDTEPSIAKMSISGRCLISGDDKEIDAFLRVEDESSVPPVFMKIYHKIYAILYLISGSLRIPYPSPGLLKSVHVASPQTVSNQIGDIKSDKLTA